MASCDRTILGITRDGHEASAFHLRAGDFEAVFSDFGARWLSFLVPDGKDGRDDLLLGCPDLAGYEVSDAYFGATVGRYANRIAGASFRLDGREYRLAANNGQNHLHGGKVGFDRRIWKARAFEASGSACIVFELESPDGEEGYPGAMSVRTTFRLSPEGTVGILYEAKADAPTVIGLTQHAYFNLAGNGRGDILDHELRIEASRYLPVDGNLIPTGEMAPVEGSPFDFRSLRRVGRDIREAGGYDHCFVLDRAPGDAHQAAECAELRHPATGRSMKVSTTMPGIQLYTGNFLEGAAGKDGRIYRKHSGLCLETECFPDSPNRPDFPSCVLRPGDTWREETRYSFGL